MAVGATPFHEELLAPLHFRVVQVAGAWNGKATMPYHEGIEIVHALLRREVVPLVVELVG